MDYVVIKKSDLDALLGYIDTLMDFIDVDDFDDEENAEAVNYGYDNFVEPLRDAGKLKSPDAFVKDNEIEVFKEMLKDAYNITVCETSDKKLKEVYEAYCERMSLRSSGYEEDVVREVVDDFALSYTEEE